jgi:hypothetical protein
MSLISCASSMLTFPVSVQLILIDPIILGVYESRQRAFMTSFRSSINTIGAHPNKRGVPDGIYSFKIRDVSSSFP